MAEQQDVVYWRVLEQCGGSSKIEIWSRPDRKDLKVESFPILDEERLRYRIQVVLRLRTFDLVKIKGAA